jgi:hypothetical protein
MARSAIAFDASTWLEFVESIAATTIEGQGEDSLEFLR